ncbi:MAG: hypothetical protein AABO58_17990 [Acidobacteriota bacterium]
MKTETFLKKVSIALSLAILIVGVSACATNKATDGQDYGQVRTEATTESTSDNQVVGTAPAPANAQNVEGTTTPAIISGPAKVDSTGRAFTSSSSGGAGNSSATGLNTNVNIIPQKSTSEVIVTQTPAVTTETTIVETPVVTETTVTETTVETPMASSTTQETTTTTSEQTTTHRRMRKD